MYSPKEIDSIKATYEGLVAEKLIGIELDAYGNPSAIYGKQVTDILVDAITSLDNFPMKCVVENAMLEASTENYISIMAGFMLRKDMRVISYKVDQCIARSIYEAAFLEIPESLFTQKEIQAMLRQHPDFEAMVQRDIDRGRLLADELDDSKERVADMRMTA